MWGNKTKIVILAGVLSFGTAATAIDDFAETDSSTPLHQAPSQDISDLPPVPVDDTVGEFELGQPDPNVAQEISDAVGEIEPPPSEEPVRTETAAEGMTGTPEPAGFGTPEPEYDGSTLAPIAAESAKKKKTAKKKLAKKKAKKAKAAKIAKHKKGKKADKVVKKKGKKPSKVAKKSKAKKSGKERRLASVREKSRIR